MELGFKNLNNKTIVQIAMEKINYEACKQGTEKGDWIHYLHLKNNYYLKFATKTTRKEFNFSISEVIKNIYCLCLSGNELHIFEVTGIKEETKKIVFNEEFKLNHSYLSEKKIHTIVIDNFDYWELQQDNNKRSESLATKDRIKNLTGQNENKPISAQFKSKEEFLIWYKEQPKKCCYCGVEEEDLLKYFNNENTQYYRNEDDKARNRGKFLEIERIVTAPKEKNVYSKDNCALACYVCNNAKSDFLSPESFKPIAEGIKKFWESKLNKKLSIPDENIWMTEIKES